MSPLLQIMKPYLTVHVELNQNVMNTKLHHPAPRRQHSVRDRVRSGTGQRQGQVRSGTGQRQVRVRSGLGSGQRQVRDRVRSASGQG